MCVVTIRKSDLMSYIGKDQRKHYQWRMMLDSDTGLRVNRDYELPGRIDPSRIDPVHVDAAWKFAREGALEMGATKIVEVHRVTEAA